MRAADGPAIIVRMASEDELREHLAVLSAFERDYREYFHALEHEVATGGSFYDPAAMADKRAAILRRAARTARAMNASGVTLTLTPPPLYGGPVLTTFVSQILAHETSTYGGGPDPLAAPRMVLDSITTGVGALEDRLSRLREKRPQARPEPRHASPRWPTLFGRLRHVPLGIGIVADVGGAAAFVALLGRLASVW